MRSNGVKFLWWVTIPKTDKMRLRGKYGRFSAILHRIVQSVWKGAAIHTRKRRAMQNGFNMLAFSRCQASPRTLSHTWHSLAIPGYGLFALDRLGNSKKFLPCIRWCSVGSLWMAWPCRGNAHPLLYGVRFVRFLAAGSLLNAWCLVTVFLLLFTENFTALSRLCIPFYTCYFCYFFACSSPVRWLFIWLNKINFIAALLPLCIFSFMPSYS